MDTRCQRRPVLRDKLRSSSNPMVWWFNMALMGGWVSALLQHRCTSCMSRTNRACRAVGRRVTPALCFNSGGSRAVPREHAPSECKRYCARTGQCPRTLPWWVIVESRVAHNEAQLNPARLSLDQFIIHFNLGPSLGRREDARPAQRMEGTGEMRNELSGDRRR